MTDQEIMDAAAKTYSGIDAVSDAYIKFDADGSACACCVLGAAALTTQDSDWWRDISHSYAHGDEEMAKTLKRSTAWVVGCAVGFDGALAAIDPDSGFPITTAKASRMALNSDAARAEWDAGYVFGQAARTRFLQPYLL